MRRSKTRRGLSMVWVALSLIVMLGLVGLAADVGYVFLVAHQLQNAADAAALAGARQLGQGDATARLAAVQVGEANAAGGDAVQLESNADNDPLGDIVLGQYDRDTGQFLVTTQSPNAVQVTARRTGGSSGGAVGLFFGPVFGVDAIGVERSAIALGEGAAGAGVIALCDDCECGLIIEGNIEFDIEGGAIQVNSDDPCAICGNGSFTIDAEALNSVGGECFNGNAGNVNGPTNTDVDPLPDPLADLPEPIWSFGASLGTIDQAGTYPAGFYAGGISLTGGAVNLMPGIYVLDGAGLQIGGNTNFTCEYCMFYVTGTGVVDIGGTGSIIITPPNPEETAYPDAVLYEGVSIFQDRDNTNDARIIGTGLLDVDGILYFPTALLEVGGTGDGFGNQLLAWQVWVHGNATVGVIYLGEDEATGGVVYLVK